MESIKISVIKVILFRIATAIKSTKKNNITMLSI